MVQAVEAVTVSDASYYNLFTEFTNDRAITEWNLALGAAGSFHQCIIYATLQATFCDPSAWPQRNQGTASF